MAKPKLWSSVIYCTSAGGTGTPQRADAGAPAMPGRGWKMKTHLLEEHQLPKFRAKSPQKMGKRRGEKARTRARRRAETDAGSLEEPVPKMLGMCAGEGEKQGK